MEKTKQHDLRFEVPNHGYSVRRNRLKPLLTRVSLFVSLVIVVVSLTNAQTLPLNKFPNCVGIAGKEIDTPTEYNEVDATGARIVRRDFSWPALETTQGVYNWANYEQIVAGLNAKGITVMGILTYGNPNYPSIYTEAGRQAFGDYAADVVEHFENDDVIWEIYNEPNLAQFWYGDPNLTSNTTQMAQEYTALANIAVAKIKARVPTATVLAPSMAGIWSSSLNWLNECINLGLLNNGIDGLAFHGYPATANHYPEFHDQSSSDGYIPLMNLLNSRGYGNIPLIHTEVGSNMDKLAGLGIPSNEVEKYQAWHMVRTALIDRKWNVLATVWYLWSSAAHDHYAMLRNSDGSKRPVYYAMQTLNNELDGYSFVSQTALSNPDDYVFLFQNSQTGAQKLVVWTAPNPGMPAGNRLPSVHNVNLSVTGTAPLNVVDYLGNSSTLSISGGQITVQLDGGPKFIALNSTGGGTGLPSPWASQDIGGVGIAGTASHSSGTFTIEGSGADIWGTADEFNYVYQPVSGDVEIIARISSQEVTKPWAKAGVMIRESLTAGSKYAFALLTGSNGSSWQSRSTTSASSSGTTMNGSDATPLWLKVVRSGNTFTEYRSTNGTSWTLGSTQTITMSNSVYVGLAVTSHDDTQLGTATFDNVSVNAVQNWSHQDVGTVSIPGTFNSSAGVYTLEGSGDDIWGTTDEFHFAYKQFTGDVDFIAQITSQENTAYWAKAGVMIRESLSDGSKYAMSLLTASNGTSWQARTATSGTSTGGTINASDATPIWLRVTRSGNTFTEYRSTNGTSWTQGASQTITMSSTVYVGFAVTSHDETELGTAVFQNATINGSGASARLGSESQMLNKSHILNEEIKVYANPVRDFVQIDGIANPTRVLILNASGQRVREMVTDSGRLDLSDLSAGFYLLMINQNRVKIIKE